MKRGTHVVARLLTTVFAVIATLALVAGPAKAHEARKVGPYDLEVGWGDEPAYAGEKNSVQVLINQGAQPVVEGVDLKAEVIFGQASLSLSIEPSFEIGEFGEPGDYRAFVIPTRPGSYTFHITGTIGKQRMDERFTSGPQTFDNINDPRAISFPVKDPTNGDLAARQLTESTRLADDVSSASDRADTAGLVSYIAVGLGVVALALGAWVALGRRSSTTAP